MAPKVTASDYWPQVGRKWGVSGRILGVKVRLFGTFIPAPVVTGRMVEVVDDVANNIRNEQRMHGVDRNPTIPCESCGDGKSWRTYWSGRINTPEDRFLCDECLEEAVNMHNRITQNNSLDDFVNS